MDPIKNGHIPAIAMLVYQRVGVVLPNFLESRSKNNLPGNSAGDLFGMVSENVTLSLKGLFVTFRGVPPGPNRDLRSEDCESRVDWRRLEALQVTCRQGRFFFHTQYRSMSHEKKKLKLVGLVI